MAIYPVTYSAAQGFSAHASDPRVFDAIWVGGAGNVTVTLLETSNSVQFVGVPAGTVLPIKTRLVTAATATNLVGLRGPSFPYYFKSAAAITLHDTNPNRFDAIYVSVGTAFVFTPLDESTDVTLTTAVGQLIPVRTRICKSTGASGTYLGLRF